MTACGSSDTGDTRDSGNAGNGSDGTPPGGASNPGAPDGGTPASNGSQVTVTVDGTGRITSIPPGIDCGNGGTACTARFGASAVKLVSDEDSTVRWSGACSGTGDCVIGAGGDHSVTAKTFAPRRITFDGPDHGPDACYAIAAGPSGSIVVAGQVRRISDGDNAWARAYDNHAGILWTYELSTPSEGHDLAEGVVALPAGGAAVAGTWFSGSNTRFNSFALDIAASGMLAWSRLEEIIGDDRGHAIARDSTGRLFLAGERPDTTGQTQAWVHALSADGSSELWSITRDGTATGVDAALGVAVDSTGDVVAGGAETNAGTGLDGWLAKYSPLGVQQWAISLSSPGDGADSIRGVAIAPDDTIVVVGTYAGASTIRAYTATGTPLWDVTSADNPAWNGVAVDSSGDVVVVGSSGGNLVVRKHASTGDLVWQRKVPHATGNAVTVDDSDNILACGTLTTAGNTDGLIVVFHQ
ncbi:MAG TPA: hypothetical protein VFT22_10730 [Kofleriaceae bacterium]|nr:hypothetical protein [Kofleriaceae bacterium]